MSTDDSAGPAANQTNLAVKAAIGLTAFGALTNQPYYTEIGQDFASIIYDDGLGTDSAKTHFTLQYGNDKSWSTTFNLFPDCLMKLNTFNTSAFDMQSSWYSTVRSEAGVALDNELEWAKTDWQLWPGATSSNSTMKMFVDDLHAYLGNGKDSAMCCLVIDTLFQGKRLESGMIIRRGRWLGVEWSAMALQGRF